MSNSVGSVETPSRLSSGTRIYARGSHIIIKRSYTHVSWSSQKRLKRLISKLGMREMVPGTFVFIS